MRAMSPTVRRVVSLTGMICLLCSLAGLTDAAEGMKVKVLASIAAEETLGSFNHPSGLFYDENKKRLYIADSLNRRIVSLDSENKFLAELTKKEIVLPVGIVRDGKGLFYIVDADRGEVLRLDVAKELVEPLQITGMPQGRYIFSPGRMALDKGDNIYIIDKLNKRVVMVDAAGEFVRALTVNAEDFYGFSDLRVDDEGYVNALDTIGRMVYIFDKKGGLVSSFGGSSSGLFLFPVSIASGRGGLVYIVDRHAGKIMVFNRSGALQYTISKKGSRDGELVTPSYIYIDESNRIYVIDGNRIQVFQEVKE